MSELEREHKAGEERPALGTDLIIPVLGMAFAIYYLVTSARLVWEARANGTLIGIALLLLIAVQVGRTVVRLRAGEGRLSLGQLGRLQAPGQVSRIALLFILIVFIAFIPWLGTTLGLFLVMLTSMAVLGVRSVGTLLGVSFASSAVVYLLFIALLQSRLPVGPVELLLNPLFQSGG